MSYRRSSYNTASRTNRPYSRVVRSRPPSRTNRPSAPYSRAPYSARRTQYPARRAPPGPRWDEVPGQVGDLLKDSVRVKFSRTETASVVVGGHSQHYFSAVNPGNVTAGGESSPGFPAVMAGYSKYYVSGAKFIIRVLPDEEFGVECKTLCDKMHPSLNQASYISNPKTQTKITPSGAGISLTMTEKYSAKHFHKIDVAQNPSIIGSVSAPPTSTVAFMVFLQALGPEGGRTNLIVQYEVDYFLRLGAPATV